jgi:hypothetical protein
MNTRKIYLGIWIFAVVAGLIAVAISEINRAERDDAGEIAKEGELEVLNLESETVFSAWI